MASKHPSSQIARRAWQRRIIRSLGNLRQGMARLEKKAPAAKKGIRRRDQLLAVLLLALWVVLLFGNFYFRGVSRFEGSLVTQAMSFTYVGEVDKQFLNSLGITKLTFQGKQPTLIPLKGKFSSPDATLNAKLKTLTQLQVQLVSPTSGLTFEVADPKQTSPLNLRQLRIFPNTQIEQLTYQPNAKQLKFCLQFHTAESNGCENASAVAANLEPIGKLEFGVDSAAINLFLANVQIPALGITESTLETQLRWLPDGQDFTLPIVSPTLLKLGLPTARQNVPEEATDDVSQLIRGDISVKQVRFFKRDRNGNVNDDIVTSEILDGEVRMMGQSLKLQPRQFLIIPTDRDSDQRTDKRNCQMSAAENPGIQRLRDIHLNTKDPKGLQTLISGESKCLAIGLYQEFPTQSIEPSWLLKYLPQEGINAIYTLIGAFTGILFPRLFPDKDESKG